jgi:hypothetical protein
MTTATITTIRPKAPLTEIQFCAWVAQSVPGDRLEYHRGFLVLDTFPTAARLSDERRKALTRLGFRAFWAAENGLVHLVQERVAPDQFAYIAIARPKPKAAEASLSKLLLSDEAIPVADAATAPVAAA